MVSTEPVPRVGELVVEDESGRVGEFRGVDHGRWWLRPPGGGIEWDVAPGAARVRAAGE
ncbi:hypothetical protein AB0K43_04675 [Kitasatospora sp. NPDC049258]|uniref:hypothetical protein n=1 Tax=Kitasatospora sp. NPDC049258 TaxID=3155394 RepID=UPI00342A07C2